MDVPAVPVSPVVTGAPPPAVAAVPASAAQVALRAFASGALVASVVISALLALELDFGIPRILVALVMGFLGFAIVSAGEGIALLLWKLLRAFLTRVHAVRAAHVLEAIPAVPVGRLLGAFLYIAGDLLWPDSFLGHVMLPVAGEIAIVLAALAGMLFALARMDGRARAAQHALIATPAILTLAFAVWVASPGFDDYLAATPAAATSSALAIPDPGAPGPFAVKTLTYGSGTSTRRPQYGTGASLTTSVVDGSAIFGGYGGLARSYHTWYWGFDFTRLPLNGMVWYPDGPGPFPLVLVVHGNHPMSEYSEPGYAYLAEHLASHGYVTVSVDENFLNGLFFFDGEFAEMPLRAWLLLQHLQQWQRWNENPGNPFTDRVDLERVALVGHSRGAEAVAWAAHLNWHTMDPVTSVSRASDFGFGIRGVVSIAPSDAYGGPGGRKPTLEHTNYLLLAGGHDADTFLLYGQKQYNRVRFNDNPAGFKALAYVYQANHGQFNTVWGNRDRGLYNSWLLNRAPLLSGSDQQQAAKVLVTGFLNAALRDEDPYRDLFRSPGAGAGWLPEGLVVTQYQDPRSIVLANNNGRAGAAQTTDARAFTTAKTEALLLRDGELQQGNRALHLAWSGDSQPVYEITLAPDEVAQWGLSPAQSLTFALAGVPGELAAKDIVVALETTTGVVSQLALGDIAPLIPPLPAHLVKARWLAGTNGFPGKIQPEEIVLQTYTVPLTAFTASNPAFEPAQLHAIRFIFDGSTPGAVYLDDVALAIQ